MEKANSKTSGCLTWGLSSLAIVLGFLSLIARPDSMEDIGRGKIFDVLILAPTWGAAVFMHTYTRFRERPYAKSIAAGLALSAWFVVAWISTSLEEAKAPFTAQDVEDMRRINERFRRSMEERAKRNLEPTNAPYSQPASQVENR